MRLASSFPAADGPGAVSRGPKGCATRGAIAVRKSSRLLPRRAQFKGRTLDAWSENGERWEPALAVCSCCDHLFLPDDKTEAPLHAGPPTTAALLGFGPT